MKLIGYHLLYLNWDYEGDLKDFLDKLDKLFFLFLKGDIKFVAIHANSWCPYKDGTGNHLLLNEWWESKNNFFS